MNQTLSQSVRSLYGVWPLTASMEVKNTHANVTTQGILNKFIEVSFLHGLAVMLSLSRFLLVKYLMQQEK